MSFFRFRVFKSSRHPFIASIQKVLDLDAQQYHACLAQLYLRASWYSLTVLLTVIKETACSTPTRPIPRVPALRTFR